MSFFDKGELIVFITTNRRLVLFIVIFLYFLFNIKRLNILYILKVAWGVCSYSFLGISCVGSWLSHGDSVLLFIPCDLGSVRGCTVTHKTESMFGTFGLFIE